MKKLELNTVLSFLPAITAKEGNSVAISGSTKARTKILYIAGLGTKLSSNNNQMLLPSDTPGFGVTNFDKGNTLAAGRQFLVTGIRILFDSTTSSVSTSNAVWKDEIPASFRNGELKIDQDGTGTIIQLPMNSLCKYSGSIPTEDDFRAVVPFLFRSLAPINIQAIQVGTVATATTAWRIEFDGIELTDVGQG